MKIVKNITIRCCNITLDNVEMVMKKKVDLIKKPSVAIFGTGVDIPKKINKMLLKAFCVSLGEKLGRKKLNILTAGTPGIPYWVAKGAKKTGGTVWTISQFSSEKEHMKKKNLLPSFPADQDDIAFYTNVDQEFVNYMIAHIADIGIFINGGLGSLIKSAILADYGKPLICLKNTGGLAGKTPDLLREGIANFKELNLYEVETINELMKIVSKLTDGRILLENKLQMILNQTI